MNNPEIQPRGAENTVETQDAAGERLKQLHEQLEKRGESSPENSGEKLETARRDTEAAFSKEAGKEQRSGGEPSGSAGHAIRKITKREKARLYKETLTRAQADMSPPARAFSKIIHAPIIEKSSDIIGNTIARPNALLYGSLTSLIFLSTIYIIARQYGYRLSGFEMIGAYGLGWIIGLCIDYIKMMATGKSIK